jgi:hypothetical protein
MFKFVDILDEKLCKKYPNAFVVFGDNLIGKGYLGQANIRDFSNAYGVPTKRLPSMKTGSFFSDSEDEKEIVAKRLDFLLQEHEKGKLIILPSQPIGSGLASLQFKSPKIAKMVDDFYDIAKNDNQLLISTSWASEMNRLDKELSENYGVSINDNKNMNATITSSKEKILDKVIIMEEHKIIEDLLKKYKRKYVKVESIDYALYPFATMNNTFIGKYKYSLSSDIKGDYLLVDGVVSHDNINKYYKFMDIATKLEHKDLLRIIHSERWEKIVTFLKEERHIFEVKEGIWDNDFLYDNCEFKKLKFDFPVNYYEETSYFGVKDILLPIDEYIEEIKDSEGYKEACNKKNINHDKNSSSDLNKILKSYDDKFKKDDISEEFPELKIEPNNEDSKSSNKKVKRAR